MEWTEESLGTIRDQHEEWLMQQSFIHGTGIGLDRQGRLCLKIYVEAAGAADREQVRQQLKDVPLQFDETGPIFAQ